MGETKLFNRVYDDIKRRRQRILDGQINCIPCTFKRFSEEWPGVEQQKMYGVTGQQKAGKTQLTDKMFLYDPLFYAFNNRDKIRLKIKYFSLEISAEEKYKQFLCHLLYILSKGTIRVSQRDLNSTIASSPLSQQIIDIMGSEQYIEYYKFFEESVEIISHIRNPTGIHAHLKKYAKENGTWAYKEIDWTEEDGSISKRNVKDYYIPNDPDEYVILIIDHISLISTESEGGKMMNLHESISKLTSKYLIDLRDEFRYIPVIVQQQALSGEGIENIKLGKLKPSVSDLGDNKLTSRDVNIFFGIFSPIRHNLHDYLGYSIDKFEDNIRFMEIMVSREGGNGSTSPLYFDGCTNYFRELPLPNDGIGIAKVYSMLDSIRQPKKVAMFLFKNDELKEKGRNYGKNISSCKEWIWKNNIYLWARKIWDKRIKSKRNIYNPMY